jgi:hypothetical protein
MYSILLLILLFIILLLLYLKLLLSLLLFRSRGRAGSLSLIGKYSRGGSGLTLLGTGGEYRTRVKGVARGRGRRFLLLLFVVFVILHYTIVEPLYIST